MIRNFMLENGEAYPRQIHKFLADAIRKMSYQIPTYESVRKFIYVL